MRNSIGKSTSGKATIKKSGDVTTIRVVDYHGQGQPNLPANKPKIPKSIPSINQEELEALKHIDIIAFTKEAEHGFIALLEYLLNEMPEGVPVVVLRAETAYKLGVSTQTSKRYIEKYCYAYSSPYKIFDGKVMRKE